MFYGKQQSKYLSTLLIYSRTSRMIVVWLLIIGDIVGLLLCFNLALKIRLAQSLNLQTPVLYALVVMYLFGLYLTDTYKLNWQVSGVSTVRLSERAVLGILAAVSVVTSSIYITGLWGSESIVGRGILAISAGLFTIWAVVSRMIADRWLRTNLQTSRFLVLGNYQKAEEFGREHRKLNSHAEFVPFSDTRAANNSDRGSNTTGGSAVLETINNASAWKQQYWSGILIDGAERNLSESMIRELMDMRLKGIYVYSIADF